MVSHTTKKGLPPLHIKGALGHWWYQRLTAIALVPLSLWLLVFLNKALNAPYTDTLAWLNAPLNVLAIALWSVIVVWHAAMGVQVVLEDYVSTLNVRQWAIRISNLIFIGVGIVALGTLLFISLAR